MTRVILLILFALCIGGGCASPLHEAAREGNVAEIRRLVANSTFRINERDRWGYTPLHMAVLYHQVEATSALIELGADVDARDRKMFWTPLDIAKLGAGHCEGTWLRDQERQINESHLQSDTKMGRVGMLKILYGPRAKPEWEAIIAMLEKSRLTAVGPNGQRYPVIARLESRQRTITIISGPNGPLYSAYTPQGETLVSNVTIDVLRDQRPDIYQEIKGAVAIDQRPVLIGIEH